MRGVTTGCFRNTIWAAWGGMRRAAAAQSPFDDLKGNHPRRSSTAIPLRVRRCLYRQSIRRSDDPAVDRAACWRLLDEIIGGLQIPDAGLASSTHVTNDARILIGPGRPPSDPGVPISIRGGREGRQPQLLASICAAAASPRMRGLSLRRGGVRAQKPDVFRDRTGLGAFRRARPPWRRSADLRGGALTRSASARLRPAYWSTAWVGFIGPEYLS